MQVERILGARSAGLQASRRKKKNRHGVLCLLLRKNTQRKIWWKEISNCYQKLLIIDSKSFIKCGPFTTGYIIAGHSFWGFLHRPRPA
jgi:hypothetical protein